ncbi:septum formation initiator family protein [Sphingomonas lacunae]|uniref:Septum formation initiator family protein n=1 Tax=Sphingomonas lacunae TaxID=2698828 RepID=A0A6M4AUT8_9SPHN|nr:septum formation initiator family protein [Sphingomonas lacunae]QJQ32804.1 septum formation initiator family protein [Sphingomonas lacunae]
MPSPMPLKRNRRDYWPVASAMFALAVILAWLLFGQTGIFAWNDYSRALNVRRAELAELKQEQARLINHQRLLDPKGVDPDLMDEQVRAELNLLHPDEIVVPLN